MKKKVREWVEKLQENCSKINEIADLCERENRKRSQAEDLECETLERESQILRMRIQVASAPAMPQDNAASALMQLRENIAAHKQTEIVFRDLTLSTDVNNGGLVQLNIQDVVKPLQEGIILNKVGVPMPTGLAGNFVWPVYEAVEATIAGEGVALGDTSIPFSKLTAQPEPIGLAIPVTVEALNQSDGMLEQIVREIMPNALIQAINRVLFSPTKVTNAVNLVGPFVAKASSATALSAVPTFKELNAMKASLLSKGVDGSRLCWVMSEANKAVLEGTPVNEKGIFVPIIQNDMICGAPVYTTSVITDDYIGLGDWTYQPMGLFGDIRLVVDPYTQARKNAIDFVMHADYGTKTLRPEAFALGKITKA